MFKKDEILFLIGAGASIDAKIPASIGMIKSLETLLRDTKDWIEFRDLYFLIKSANVYADGIRGNFDHSSFNIERLVNTLDELLKSDEHPLFPFIGSWTPKLPEVSGDNFEKILKFREKIVRQLRDEWVKLDYDYLADYFKGLNTFQEEYEFPLRIFTLNYDLCIEKACASKGVERGFGESKIWDWRVFDDEDRIQNSIFLYKLHGSIDWYRENGNLIFKEGNINPEDLEIIFGTTYKLQYLDPFLFFAYEFRKRTLSDVKLIICVGYGFADDHINGIISQSLKSNKNRKVLVITPIDDDLEASINSSKANILRKLDIEKSSSIEILNMKARDFFENHLSLKTLEEYIPKQKSPFDKFKSSKKSS